MGIRRQNKKYRNKQGGFLGPSENVVVMVIKDPRSNPEQFIHQHEVHENPQEMIQQIIGDQTRKPPIIEMPMNALPMNALPMNALPMNALLMDQLKNDYSPMTQSLSDDSGFIFETPEDIKNQSKQRKQTMKDIIQELSKQDTKPMLMIKDKPKKKLTKKRKKPIEITFSDEEEEITLPKKKKSKKKKSKKKKPKKKKPKKQTPKKKKSFQKIYPQDYY